jgi:hypothetical protein
LLAQGEINDADLVLLLREFGEEAEYPGLRIFTRGARGVLHEDFGRFERAEASLDHFFNGTYTPPDWMDKYLGWRERDTMRQEHAVFLPLMTRRFHEVQLPPAEQVRAEQKFVAEVSQLPLQSRFSRLFLDYCAKEGAKIREAQAYMRCIVVALATERYRWVHGTWPARLDIMAPAPLAAVPVDPFDGGPLRCRRLDDGFVIYSIGQDLVNDGGRIDKDDKTFRTPDVGCHLWDVPARRRQPVVPPAE